MASAGATRVRGHPVQIVVKNDDGKTTFDQDALSSILHHPSALNRKLVVISVVGVLRGGKSFLLNYMLRYLEADGAADLLDDTKPLEGFPWQGGHDRTTIGIWIWSKPFLRQLPEGGEKVAVLLVDTQGTFDQYSSSAENSRIFVLSTLLSSVQTYNLKHNIDQRDLQYLRVFAEYAAATAHWDSDGVGIPLQKLIFLVRDYTLSSKRGFGGGRPLLNKLLLEPSSDSEEPMTTPQRIVECFNEFDCYLMSNPGNAVSKPDFDGNANRCAPKFQRELKEYVDGMLAPSNLLVKTVNGDEVTGASLLVYARMYADVLDNAGVDQAKSIAVATVHGHLAQIRLDALKMYSDEMRCVTDAAAPYSTQTLEEEHNSRLGRALALFDRKVKLGGAAAKEEERQALIVDVKDVYVKLIIPANNANRAAMEMKIERAALGAFQAYINAMDATNEYTTGRLNDAHEEAKRIALAHWWNLVRDYEKAAVDKKRSDLLEDIQLKYKVFLMRASGNPLGEAVLEATAQYDADAERFKSLDVSDEQWQGQQQEAKDTVIARIRRTNADPVLVEEVVTEQSAYMDRKFDRTKDYRDNATRSEVEWKSALTGVAIGVALGVGGVALGIFVVAAAAEVAAATLAVQFGKAAAGLVVCLAKKYGLASTLL